MLKPILTVLAISAISITILNTSFADKRVANRGGQQFHGPDVVAWYVGGSGGLDMQLYGEVDGVLGFAFGTTSCNFGDMEADWGAGGNTSYPVIAQTCYRLKDGRFEQIGTAWLKHSFCAVSEPGCGNCQATPCSTLGIGCADTYWAGLNANAIAPRSDINAYTGSYEYPFSISPTGPSGMRGKLQLKIEDIDPALNEGARYILECQYVSFDDAQWGNQDNNCSWRWIKFNENLVPSKISSTQVTDSALYAWLIFDQDVDIRPLRVPDEGLLEVAVQVYDNEDGTWRYEYTVHNMNSDLSVGSFSIPLQDCIELSDIGFHDIDYTSGEVIDSTDWDIQVTENEITWKTDTFEQNEWANAIRWGSSYNFWFTANQGPENGDLNLGMFKPGGVPSVAHTAAIPRCPVKGCIGDVDGSGLVDVEDILLVVGAWDTDDQDADVNNDGIVNVEDLLEVVGNWGCN